MAIDNETKELLLTFCALLRHQIEMHNQNRHALLALRRAVAPDGSAQLEKYEEEWKNLAIHPEHTEPTSHLLVQLDGIVQKLKG
jgi:hypothetical protein